MSAFVKILYRMHTKVPVKAFTYFPFKVDLSSLKSCAFFFKKAILELQAIDCV